MSNTPMFDGPGNADEFEQWLVGTEPAIATAQPMAATLPAETYDGGRQPDPIDDLDPQESFLRWTEEHDPSKPTGWASNLHDNITEEN